MLSFRGKVVVSYLFIFLIFLGLLYPFASQSVKGIAKQAMQSRATQLIAKIQSAPNDDALIRRLKDQKHLVFFRISIITEKRQILYDSHASRILGGKFSRLYVVDHPEVNQAFQGGAGYYEDYSELLEQKFAYVAQAFPFHDKVYVMRVAFPFEFVNEMTRDFEMGFLLLGGAALLLFAVLSLFVVNHLSLPIRQIIEAVRPYQKGEETKIPTIYLSSVSPGDDFDRLARTLNSLSARVRSQINVLIHERNEKEAVLSSLIEGVIAVDQDLKVSYANTTAYQLLNVETSILEEPFAVTNLRIGEELLRNCMDEGKVLVTDAEFQGKQLLSLDLIAAPKTDGGAVLVIQDKSLQNRVVEMGKDFIANASHELRTPITIIRGFAETLHDNPDLPRDMAVDITEKIVRNCDRMAELVKTLLTLAGIEKLPPTRFKPCSLAPVLRHCQETLLSVFTDAQLDIHFSPEEPYEILGDTSMLELAFYNLFNNAAKYTDGPAKIHVHIEVGKNNFIIKVQDYGMGIPKEDLEHIFMRFYTVDKAHTRRLGGTGLGLSLVQTIIEKHGGEINVHSILGEGSTFTVTLPKLSRSKPEPLLGSSDQ